MNEVNYEFERWEDEQNTSDKFLLAEGGDYPPGCIPLYRDRDTYLLVMQIRRNLNKIEEAIKKAAMASDDEISGFRKLVAKADECFGKGSELAWNCL